MVFGGPAEARVEGWRWRPLADAKTSPAVDQTHCTVGIIISYIGVLAALGAVRGQGYIGKKMKKTIIDADHLLKRQ